MNTPKEPDFIALKHGMENLMHHPHEPITYSRKKIHKTDKISHQCYFKSGDAKISKKKEYSNFLQTYCDADHTRDIFDRYSVTYTVNLLNITLIECCVKK